MWGCLSPQPHPSSQLEKSMKGNEELIISSEQRKQHGISWESCKILPNIAFFQEMTKRLHYTQGFTSSRNTETEFLERHMTEVDKQFTLIFKL